MAEQRVLSPEQQAKLNSAFSGVVTPYSQVRETLSPDPGTYVMLFRGFKPDIAENGMYVIEVDVKFLAPQEAVSDTPAGGAKRTLYIGTRKDPMAEHPETRLNSPGLRWLKLAAKACDVPVNDQTDGALCAALLNKQITCRIDETTYDKKADDGTVTKAKGWDFGRTPMKVGSMPAKLDKSTTVGAQVATAAATPAAGFGE